MAINVFFFLPTMMVVTVDEVFDGVGGNVRPHPVHALAGSRFGDAWHNKGSRGFCAPRFWLEGCLSCVSLAQNFPHLPEADRIIVVVVLSTSLTAAAHPPGRPRISHVSAVNDVVGRARLSTYLQTTIPLGLGRVWGRGAGGAGRSGWYNGT